MTLIPQPQTEKSDDRARPAPAPDGAVALERTPKRRRAKARPTPPEPEVSHAQLCQQMAEEAQRLRLLAATVRERVKVPVIEEYVRSGRGPSYQRDYERWSKNEGVAEAFDRAAYRLEEALASPMLAG